LNEAGSHPHTGKKKMAKGREGLYKNSARNLDYEEMRKGEEKK
jgi:hypothetical protein